jgi:hypothetical protein
MLPGDRRALAKSDENGASADDEVIGLTPVGNHLRTSFHKPVQYG